MGRENARKKFARTMAVLGLAAVTTNCLTGPAGAAPADRGGDAVVLKGSAVPGLAGVAPARIVAFKWTGKWVQVPVQVDERHTINARQLYPETGNGYVGDTTLGFELEVYADPKTRSGADGDAGFDADDEVAFMARDTGRRAPKKAGAPSGVIPGSGTRIAVKDPLGGGKAFTYLFRSRGLTSTLVGRDYVKYDFNLSGLTEGQNLRDDYGYFTSSNPEDSTVTTGKYRLHSFDRWQEDEMRITAGNASGADILDREVAQATRNACVRSEYTFSGRWTEDLWAGNDTHSDDEGTYVAVIDGPVRAIRSYMGANSGPYVQREHIYYADYEQNNIYLRVHTMTDLYSWTDYSPEAIGMTYRDMKNTGGVAVDGKPDTLVPSTAADVANGAYAWQQLSGPQGTVSTVIASDTDIPDPAFGNYYLDDLTPTAANETQCGGDGQSIGASGFGILGSNGLPITPNTDPRLGTFNNLTVKRTRYFGPPEDGVAAAENYRSRVSKPLAGNAATAPMKKARAGLRIRLINRKVKAVRGKRVRLRLRLTNKGNVPIHRLKVCVKSRSIAGRPCVRSRTIAIGKSRNVTVRVKIRNRARGKKVRLAFSYKAQAGDYGIAARRGGPALRLRR